MDCNNAMEGVTVRRPTGITKPNPTTKRAMLTTIKPKTIHRHSKSDATIEGHTGVTLRIERNPMRDGNSWKELADQIGCKYNNTSSSLGYENLHVLADEVCCNQENSGNFRLVLKKLESKNKFVTLLPPSSKTWRKTDKTAL